MTPNFAGAGAVVTAMTVVAAVVAVWNQPTVATVDTVNEPAFTALRTRLDDVARITIAGPSGALTLVRDGEDEWVVRDRYDFPAATDRVRTLVGTAADMRLVEPKTARADRFARLEVEDLGTDGARSRSMRIESEGGDVLADAIVGKRLFSVAGGREAGTYVRRSGDDRAWLVSGGLDVETEVTQWLERGILDVPAERIQRIDVVPASGVSYSVLRDGPDADLQMSSAPASRKPDPSAIRRMASGFAGLELDDVAPVGAMELPEDVAAVELHTFDGERIALRIGVIEDAHWATVSTDSEHASEDAAGDVTADGAAKPSDSWLYQLSATVADRIAPEREALLLPAEEQSEQQ